MRDGGGQAVLPPRADRSVTYNGVSQAFIMRPMGKYKCMIHIIFTQFRQRLPSHS